MMVERIEKQSEKEDVVSVGRSMITREVGVGKLTRQLRHEDGLIVA